MYPKVFLIYLELSEVGSETAQINSALLINNYKIFKDKNFKKFLAYKFYYMPHFAGNSLTSLKLGDFFLKGYGGIKKDIEKAKQYFEDSREAEIISDSFKLSHADFNLGMIKLFNENSTNIIDNIYQSDYYFNSSKTFEILAYYPIKIVQFYYKYFYKGKYRKFSLIKKYFLII